MGYFFQLSAILIVFALFAVTTSLSATECGILHDKNKIPWVVGIYLEQEKDRLELVCLGSVLKDNHVITASQCVCETLSENTRKENIYISRKIEKTLTKNANIVQIKSQNVLKPKEYQGFLLSPLGDLAVLKIENSSQPLGNPVCIEWSDLTKLLQTDTAGILSIWDARIKTADASFSDYDFCQSATSEDFTSILSSDKDCFTISGTNFDSHSVGSGIYYKNSNDGRWYLEGVVSGSESAKGSVFLAATSVRRYLAWLSRVYRT